MLRDTLKSDPLSRRPGVWDRVRAAVKHEEVLQLIAQNSSFLNDLDRRMRWRPEGRDGSQPGTSEPTSWTLSHRQHAESLHQALSLVGPHDLRLRLESTEHMSAAERFSKDKT